MKSELLETCDQLLCSGLTGLYQGILITILAGLGLRLLSRTNAATRHAIWMATLALVVSLIPAHCLRDYLASRKAASGIASIASVDSPPPVPSPAPQSSTATGGSSDVLVAIPEPAGGESLEAPETPPEMEGDQSFPASGAAIPVPSEFASPEAPHDAGRLTDPAAPEPAHPTISSVSLSQSRAMPRWQASDFLQPVAWRIAPEAKLPRMTSLALLAGCLTVGLLRVGLLLRRLGEIRRLKGLALPGPKIMHELFERLRCELGVRRKVKLRVSGLRHSPVLAGFIHPVVLMPAGQPVAPNELEPILRHELAHVMRCDDWANLGQQVVQAVLFFHPGVGWISRQLSIEREIACDDHVLQQGSRARAYALLLTDFAARFNTCRPLPAPGVSINQSQLQKRINMILNSNRNMSPRLARTTLGIITSAAALVTVIALYAAPRIVFAQAASAPAARNNGDAPPPAPPLVNAPAEVPLVPPFAPIAEPQAPPAPGQPSVAPGAKPKPRMAGVATTAVAPLAVPVTPVPPGAVVLASSPNEDVYVVAGRADAPRAPKPPRAPDVKDADSSIEDRLDRLEKMVQSLVERQDRKGGERPGEPVALDPEHLKRMQELAHREAARAADQVNRATREAEKARKVQQEHAQGKVTQDLTQHMQALDKQREALQREVEKLERQIERIEQEKDKLEQQQEKIQEEREGRSELLQEQNEEHDELALVEPPCVDAPEAEVSLAR